MIDHQPVENGVLWVTLALINAGLAQAKNRSGWEWFVLSLLFGPVATLAIVLPSPGEKKTRSVTGAGEQRE